jgi:tetratricopeptide (TPR) repeat protein
LLARALYNRASLHVREGKPAEAAPLCDRALGLLAEVIGTESELQEHTMNRIIALRIKAEVAEASGDQKAVRGSLDEAAKNIEDRLKPDRLDWNPDSPDLLHLAATLDLERGHSLLAELEPNRPAGRPFPTSGGLTRAAECFGRALEKLRPLARDYPGIPLYRMELASALRGRASTAGSTTQAEADCTEALTILMVDSCRMGRVDAPWLRGVGDSLSFIDLR